jgi:hypothetical protein
MTAPRIEPGVLCILVRSQNGNTGRVVEAVRQCRVFELSPETPGYHCPFDGWVIRASPPLRMCDGRLSFYASAHASALLPITPPPGADTEHTDTPADAVPA